MNYAPFVAAALFAVAVLAANSAMAASSIHQSITQNGNSDSSSTTIIRQSSSQSSSRSNSLVVSNSSVSSRSVTGSDLQIDQDLSGKIASSQLNLTSGDVEAVLFGNWTLDSAGFAANFTLTPTNGTGATEYEMDDLKLASIQEVNDSLVLSGSTDIASNGTRLEEDAPVTIMVQSDILVVGFDKDTGAGDLFHIPIIGFAQ